nr:EOG090X0CJ3 [Sida crystallina]
MELCQAINQQPNDVVWTAEDGDHQLWQYLQSQGKNPAPQIGINSGISCVGSIAAVVVDPRLQSVVSAACIRNSNHPLKHTVMVAIDLVARAQGGGAWYPASAEGDAQSYLCTDYEFYLTDEPCIMCCMALLHSRVQCVFFNRRAVGGGLVSAVRLHCLPGINHRYQVFEGFDVEQPSSGDPAAAETKTGPSFWSFGYYQRFFDVDTPQVKDRLIWSFIPRPSQDVLTSYIRPSPDLYGPFWICVTLVFCIAIMGNIADYLQSGGGGKHWRYDFRKVSISASTIFSYALLLPTLLWLLLWWRKKQGELFNLGFMEIVCLYGYSLAIYIPVSVLWTIPLVWLQWALVIAAAALSGSVLVLALWAPLSSSRKGLAVAVLSAVLVCHVLLAAGLQLYFFRYESPSAVGPTNSTQLGNASQPLAALSQVREQQAVDSAPAVTDPKLDIHRPPTDDGAKSVPDPPSTKMVQSPLQTTNSTTSTTKSAVSANLQDIQSNNNTTNKT